MSEDRLTFVIDTNVLIDYIDIIPSPDGKEVTLEESTVDLSRANIVIPSVVIRELSGFKKEKSERGKAARAALKRIREIVECNERHTIDDVYNLNAPMNLTANDQTLSILPVHKNFDDSLFFHPSDEDMDGQIILATLTVMFIDAGLPIDGTVKNTVAATLEPNTRITLLTNDNGLAIRANERGIHTMRYGYKYPKPYTGRRDIAVPSELYGEFINSRGRGIARTDFEEQLPNEPRLIANEFIVMEPEDPTFLPTGYNPKEDPYFQYIGRYDVQTESIVPLQYVKSFPTGVSNPGQAIYAEALMDPNIAAVICTGPAGSGKTYMSTIYGYEACKHGDYIGVTAVPCENHSNIGALPGELEEKMDPDVQPLKNALRNYFLQSEKGFRKKDRKKNQKNAYHDRDDNGAGGPQKNSLKARLKDHVDMVWENWFSSVPIENARGRDFAYELAIYDEFQDQNAKQADTLIKRIGADGKIVLTGDVRQIHSAYNDQSNNGLVYASKLLFDNPLVAQVNFVESEVIRHPLVKIIARKQELESANQARPSELS